MPSLASAIVRWNAMSGTPKPCPTSLATTTSAPVDSAKSYIRSSASVPIQSSWSMIRTCSPLAIGRATLRGVPGQPEFGMWTARMCGFSAAIASSRSPLPSVEPSSTRIASHSPAGIVWRWSEPMGRSRYGPGL